VFDNPKKGLHRSARAYHAKQKDIDSVRRDLEKSGFKILAESPLGLSVLGEAKQFEQLTGGEVRTVHFARTIGPDAKTPSRGPKSLTLVAFCARLALDDD
jgi:hypothetical protein